MNRTSATAICENCRYATAAPIDPNNLTARHVICRRFPPTVHSFPMSNGAVATVSNYPTVDAGMSCGEFTLQTEN